MRFAARKGSMAEAKASIEKLGMSKNPTERGPAVFASRRIELIF